MHMVILITSYMFIFRKKLTDFVIFIIICIFNLEFKLKLQNLLDFCA